MFASLAETVARLYRKLSGDSSLSAVYVRTLPEVVQIRSVSESVMRRLAQAAMDRLDSRTAEEVEMALAEAREIVEMLGESPGEEALQRIAIERLLAELDRGELRYFLATRAVESAQKIEDELVRGLVQRRSEEQTLASIGEVASLHEYEVLRIVRTETHRARREAARIVAASAPGCRGWIWVCSLSPTSCGLCWAMHGSTHDSSEKMATHPNCSCQLVPWFGESVEDGEAAFARLTNEEQDTTLGAATARAYRAGELVLADLVEQKEHPLWGPVGNQKSLKSVLGTGAEKYYKAA